VEKRKKNTLHPGEGMQGLTSERMVRGRIGLFQHSGWSEEKITDLVRLYPFHSIKSISELIKVEENILNEKVIELGLPKKKGD
jgi:hypothetical protein